MTAMMNTDRLKIGILSSRKPHSQEVMHALFDKLKAAGFILTPKDPDIVITIGGDGLLLSAFHKYRDRIDKVRFVGIHTGHLGFYTDYLRDEIDVLVADLKKDRGASISYPLLSVLVRLNNGQTKEWHALNEITIKRHTRTMVADVAINGHLLEQFRGDGIAVSTPTGSTAYNKSLGGAVLHPTIEAMQLAEIASLNNRVFRTLGSPIVVPKKDVIRLMPTHKDRYILTVDNKTYSYDAIAYIDCRIAQQKIHFVATSHHTGFWERVKEAFIGEAES